MRLCFEKYTNNDIECILRDLSVSENLDIKTLLEKHRLSQLEDNKSKKIRQIINNNKMTLNKNKLDKDMERLKYFKNLKNINNEILREISNFSTEFHDFCDNLCFLKSVRTFVFNYCDIS